MLTSTPAPAVRVLSRTGDTRWRQIVALFFLLGYFAWFNWDTVRVHLAADDIMNLVRAWRLKPLGLLLAQCEAWRGFDRPLAGLFSVPLFSVFGLNPVPYHVALLFLLAANLYLMYRFARLLGAGELAAGLATLVAAYHVGLQNLYYNTAFIYDALCFSFYIGAFVFYMRVRTQCRLLMPRELAVFLGLYLCALNSKEMAITLPAMLLIWEWIYHRPAGYTMRDLTDWIRGPGSGALFAAALILPFAFGKLAGLVALAQEPGYQMEFTLVRLLDFQHRSLSDLLLHWQLTRWPAVIALWLALLYVAWRRPNPTLRFCWFFMALTPLPIAFFVQGRGAACLYIPLAGWAVFAAVVFVDLARAIAGFLSGEPLLRRLGRPSLFAAFLALAVFAWARANHRIKQSFVVTTMAGTGQATFEVIEQLRALHPKVSPHDDVVFLNDPFDNYDMSMIAELWFRDHTVSIHLQRYDRRPPAEVAGADRIFEFEGGKLIQRK